MGGDQKLKDGDEIAQQMESTNAAELLFFSDKAQVYKLKAADFADTKASVMGEYVPARVQMDEGESAAYMAVTTDFKGYMLFVFDNGKVAKVELSAYYTKKNRRKLINAYSDKAPLAAALQILEDCDVLLTSSSGRRLLMNTALIAPKTTKSTQGVAVMNLKKGQRITDAHIYQEDELQNPSRYRKKIPGARRTAGTGEGGRRADLAVKNQPSGKTVWRSVCAGVRPARRQRSVLLKGGQHAVRTTGLRRPPGKAPARVTRKCGFAARSCFGAHKRLTVTALVSVWT